MQQMHAHTSRPLTARATTRWSVASWQLAQLLLVFCLTTITFLIVFLPREQGIIAAGWIGGIAVALAFALAARLVILDLLTEFHYREKFAAFLFHVLALMAPKIFFSQPVWPQGFAALAVLIAFHAVKPEHFGRLMATLAVMVVMAHTSPVDPPFALVAAWLAVFLLAARATHTRFLLEGNREGLGPEVGFEFTQAGSRALGAVAIAALVWVVGYHALTRRASEFHLIGPAPPPTRLGHVTSSFVLWDFIILVMMIAALLAVASWLEKYLRLRKRPKQLDEGTDAAGVRVVRLAEAAESSAALEAESGPRARILAALRGFSARLAPFGRSRRETETAREFTRRVAEATRRRGEAGNAAELFERACYSTQDISLTDADSFDAYLETEWQLVQEAGRMKDEG